MKGRLDKASLSPMKVFLAGQQTLANQPLCALQHQTFFEIVVADD
jgi:hypothetical protein